jgi:hypothetical protein
LLAGTLLIPRYDGDAILIILFASIARIREAIINKRAFEPEIVAVPTSSPITKTNEILVNVFRIPIRTNWLLVNNYKPR